MEKCVKVWGNCMAGGEAGFAGFAIWQIVGLFCVCIPSHTEPPHSFAVPSPRLPQVLAEAFHEKEDEVDSLTEQLEEARRKLEEAARQLEAASLRQGAAQRQLEAGMLQAAGLKVCGEGVVWLW